MRRNNKNSIKKFVEATNEYLIGLGAELTYEGSDWNEYKLETKAGNLSITLPLENSDEHEYVYTIYARFKDSYMAFENYGSEGTLNRYSGKYNLLVCGSVSEVISNAKYHFGVL